MGEPAVLNQQLGVNEFAEALFPTLTKYFGAASEETPDEVIDRAYVATDEIGRYEGVLETYLKDRATQAAGTQLKAIETTKNKASGISTEVQKFSQNPTYYSRVQLIIGAVGAGKSTFIRRYYRKLMSSEVKRNTRWAFLDFNVLPPNESLQTWIADRFIDSFSATNNEDLFGLEKPERIFSHELTRFDRGPNKRLRKLDAIEFERRRSTLLEELTKSPTEFAKCVSRYYSGERGLGIVVVFDNVDKRDRDQQLAIFEAAQWFKDVTRALILVNLRDSTFEAHRDEPPLDAFANAINFYIRPPRFAQVIKKRLELILDQLPHEVAKYQSYTLNSGQKVSYPASKLGNFLMTIYLSLFDQRSLKVAAAMEALVAKDVRRALGMFADILVSPHIPTNQITSTMITSGENKIPEYRIIRSLMNQRYKYYNGKSTYIHNLLKADLNHNRPSNLLKVDILEFLIRNRKVRVDFQQEGYVTVGTLKKSLGSCGYDGDDVGSAIDTLADWGMIEPESHLVENLSDEDAVRVHATGFIHMKFFLDRAEYLVGMSTDLNFSSRSMAEDLGNVWGSRRGQSGLSKAGNEFVISRISRYMDQEYQRRCHRHPFYEEKGYGGRSVVASLKKALERIQKDKS